MTTLSLRNFRAFSAHLLLVWALSLSVAVFATVSGARAQSSPSAFAQAVAEAAARDSSVAAFYKANGYKAIWTGTGGKDRSRRKALLQALSQAGDHGLPAYETDLLRTNLGQVKSVRDLGKLEVQMSKLFLRYARDVQTGIVKPSSIDSGIVRDVPVRDRAQLLAAFAKSSPAGFLKALPPKAPEYARLMKEKIRLEKLLARGGWGPKVPAKSLKPGQSGKAVVALRDRLQAMGYLKRSSTQTYDVAIQKAVQLFQRDHGLLTDGVVGAGTMNEINVPVQKRLVSVIVAMERERWMNIERGKRHIWVNLTDFTAKIVDGGKTVFRTRSVIGKNVKDQRSPEFSDVMEFMVVNPTWNVPRSIATKEYLPMLKKNPNAVSHLKLIDSRGRTVNRGSVDFTQFTEKSFPFAIKQAPSGRNALGLVKFMFPNRHNIYLHDTPSKSLFSRETRAFSHGCIRLNDPFDFAYALLAKQTKDPKGVFHKALNSGKETRIDLQEPLPVHLVYRTAVMPAKGRANYRRDVYGRDAKIWQALSKAGVALRAVDS
ncbi:L,D-transpeptidase family protein [Aliiroseovarius crassostreae]|uniref:L,D-transpeptidase family protein n=1 Tax=Aliiroseovarius crassostreae TaxID=154981 RepID=UPI0021AE76C7|nr:L,D-transpeptidase family protein [Aliiroseovarius crassostreae]UWQ09104.1 L,D-transpeptidase family protein [Aliiroseovarius crassostreae]